MDGTKIVDGNRGRVHGRDSRRIAAEDSTAVTYEKIGKVSIDKRVLKGNQ